MKAQVKSEGNFSIGELARELGLTTRTIRYYEERGLLSPQRTAGGQRIYGRRERGRLKLILRARGLFSLAEIKEVLAIYDAQPNELGEQQQFVRLAKMMAQRIDQIDRQMEELAELNEILRGHLERVRALIWSDPGESRSGRQGDGQKGNSVGQALEEANE